ncbi:hypothetical protein AB4089_02170 [Arthrobacter sp. 2MCAF15]|uniref:hypothetical protein n=1 Tax=Arthrobacter sp. 2MCAF15 TaxID=3232984 RepID=UPI003F8E82CC
MFFNGYLLPPVTPPSIFVVKDSHTINYRTAGITSAIGQYRLDVLNKIIDDVVAEPEFAGPGQTRTVHAGVGFNWDNMGSVGDEIHRNDAGHLAQAVTTLEQLKTLPLRYGMRA